MAKMPDGFVDMVICSPPYWALRDYDLDPQIWDNHNGGDHEWSGKLFERKRRNVNGAVAQVGNTKKGISGIGIQHGCFCLKCNAWSGSLGLEPDYNLYIKHLILIFDEVWRALKDMGSCWVNIGDTYGGSGGAGGDYNEGGLKEGQPRYKGNNVMPKSVIGIPERFALAMQDRGWLRRNTIIWHKKNCMPSSATDRFTVDFEPVYFFTKQGKYYFEQQFESAQDWGTRDRTNLRNGTMDPKLKHHGLENCNSQEQGRNKRCVWTIPTQSFPEAHFAVYPEALIEPPIKAGCPQFICKRCGKAKEKIYEGTSNQAFNIRVRDVKENRIKHSDRVASLREVENYQEGVTHTGDGKKFKGYTDCGCNAGFEPGIVYDPFMGTATTAKVALELGRRFIGSELSSKYCGMGNRRIKQELAQGRFSLAINMETGPH